MRFPSSALRPTGQLSLLARSVVRFAQSSRAPKRTSFGKVFLASPHSSNKVLSNVTTAMPDGYDLLQPVLPLVRHRAFPLGHRLRYPEACPQRLTSGHRGAATGQSLLPAPPAPGGKPKKSGVQKTKKQGTSTSQYPIA